MKLEQQVVSLELAQKLKELVVKQESWHYWQWIEAHQDYELDNGSEENKVSAFTVAELGEMLPSYILINGLLKFLYCWKDDAGMWRIHYAQWGEMTDFFVDKCVTEADARAKMLVYLLENGLIK